MPSLIDGIFWGVLLIAVGAWFILRRFLPVHIPVIRLIIAVVFIYVGMRVLVRGPFAHERPVPSPSHTRDMQRAGTGTTTSFSAGETWTFPR